MLENACYKLDAKTAASGNIPENASLEFTNYVSTLQKLQQFQEQLAQCEDNATTAEEIALWISIDDDEEASGQAEMLLKECEDFRQEAKRLVSINYLFSTGCMRQLNPLMYIERTDTTLAK